MCRCRSLGCACVSAFVACSEKLMLSRPFLCPVASTPNQHIVNGVVSFGMRFLCGSCYYATSKDIQWKLQKAACLLSDSCWSLQEVVAPVVTTGNVPAPSFEVC